MDHSTLMVVKHPWHVIVYLTVYRKNKDIGKGNVAWYWFVCSYQIYPAKHTENIHGIL